MPRYDYRCDYSECSAKGTVVERKHGMKEIGLQNCSECKTAMVQMFIPHPIVFKGNGFYKTDSRIIKKQEDTY